MNHPNPQFGQLKLVGRISLWFAVVALAALAVIALIAQPIGDDYLETIRAMSASRRQLPMLMAIGGLLLVLGTALTTWAIALYSSFRVAGPLHRFCIDLEEGIRSGQVPRIRVRSTDYVQDEAAYLEDTVCRLYAHYDELADALQQTGAALARGAPPDAAGEEVHRLIGQVRL